MYVYVINNVIMLYIGICKVFLNDWKILRKDN